MSGEGMVTMTLSHGSTLNVGGVPLTVFKPGRLVVHPTLGEMAARVHEANAKWWLDLTTGESILETRSRGDLLMLVVTELVEASDGIDGRADDKLTHLPMYDCELADTAIRLFDLVGAEMALGRVEGTKIPMVRFRTVTSVMGQPMRRLSRDAQLFEIVKMVARAKENERKHRWTPFHWNLVTAIEHIFELAAEHRIDLWDVIDQKMAFNATRVDHSIEHRRGPDGKRS